MTHFEELLRIDHFVCIALKRFAARSALELTPYLGVLVVSAAGMCLAFIAFIFENICFRRHVR